MTVLESMQDALRGAGYHPESGGVHAELMAYAAGLAGIEEEADALYKAMFICTAGEKDLERFETPVSPQIPHTDVNTRREILLHRAAVTPDDLSLAALERHLPAACVRGTLAENPDKTVTVAAEELLGVTREQAEYFLRLYLPAHLAFTLQLPAAST